MSRLYLRPHHALCLRFFEGKGYSEGFVSHMYDVLRRLGDDPEVELAGGCDAICSACPHRIGGVCESCAKVEEYDSRVLSEIGREVGDILRWRELCGRVDETILSQRKLDRICRGCQWLSICKEKSDTE